MVLKNECIYPSIFLKTAYTGFCYCCWLPPMLLTSSSLSSLSIHSKIAKLLINEWSSFRASRPHCPCYGVSEKNYAKEIKSIQSAALPVLLPPLPAPSGFPSFSEGGCLLCFRHHHFFFKLYKIVLVLPNIGIIILKMTLWMIPSNSLWCGRDWQKLL